MLERSRQLGLLLCVAMLAGLIAGVVIPGGPARAQTLPTTLFCAEPEEVAFLRLINAYRAENGLGPLALSLPLSAAAEYHSTSMALNNYFDHFLIFEDIDWSDNIQNHGYGSWAAIGENIAAGRQSASAVMTQWKNSPAHNANMLDDRWTAIGIGRAHNVLARYDWYWTTTFGSTTAGGVAPICGEATPTPTVPTSMATSTPVPPTPSPTRTVVPPTATSTRTPLPPTATPRPTSTLAPPTASPSRTPVATVPATATPVPAAAMLTPVPPTATTTTTPVPTTTATQIRTATSAASPATATVTSIQTATPTPSSVPAATSTPTAPVVRPREAASMVLSKEKSKFNGVVDASLAGFVPGAAVTLRWPDGSVIATTTADSFGRATPRFRTPLVPLGTYRVEAVDTSGNVASDSLAVIPRIMLNEEAGPVSTRLRVYFYGFAPGEQVEVRWYAAGDTSFAVLQTVLIASNGRGSSLITIPAMTAAGDHKVMGRVVGIARSASTPFVVTSGARSAAVEEPGRLAAPTAIATSSPTPEDPIASPIAEPAGTPLPVPTMTMPATETPVVPVAPEPTATETTTPEPDAVDTATPVPTAEIEPPPTPEAPAVPSADEELPSVTGAPDDRLEPS